MQKVRVVLDTNMLISGIKWKRGKPRKILSRGLKGEFTILITTEILNEMCRVLRKKFDTSDVRSYRWYRLIGSRSEIVRPKGRIEGVSVDPDDDKFLACALYGGAKFIVSGDPHLRDLKKYRGIEILSGNKFLVYMDSKKDRLYLKV